MSLRTDIFAEEVNDETHEEQFKQFDDNEIYADVISDDNSVMIKEGGEKATLLERPTPSFETGQPAVDLTVPTFEAISSHWVVAWDARTDSQHRYVRFVPVDEVAPTMYRKRIGLDVAPTAVDVNHETRGDLYVDQLLVVSAATINAVVRDGDVGSVTADNNHALIECERVVDSVDDIENNYEPTGDNEHWLAVSDQSDTTVFIPGDAVDDTDIIGDGNRIAVSVGEGAVVLTDDAEHIDEIPDIVEGTEVTRVDPDVVRSAVPGSAEIGGSTTIVADDDTSQPVAIGDDSALINGLGGGDA